MMTGHRIKIVWALVALAITGVAFNVAAEDIAIDLDGQKEPFKDLVVPDRFMNPPIAPGRARSGPGLKGMSTWIA